MRAVDALEYLPGATSRESRSLPEESFCFGGTLPETALPFVMGGKISYELIKVNKEREPNL